jgi:hypothetical protein
MTAVRVTIRAALLAALLVWSAIAPARADARRALQASLDAGKPVVLVVSRPATAADMRSEAYADWAGYLNDFAADHRGRFTFLKVEPGGLKRLFAESTPIKEPFATIFIRSRNRALYYDGMIFDRVFYRFAADFLAGKDGAPDEASTGMKPFRFRVRSSR